MIIFICIVVLYYTVLTVIEPDTQQKKIYAAIVAAGLIALGIAAGL